MRLRTLLFPFATAIALVGPAAPAGAYHSAGLHWAGGQGGALPVLDRTSSAAVRDAINRWNAGLTNIKLDWVPTGGGCDGSVNLIQVCPDAGTGRAYTRWEYDGYGHFTWADVHLNPNIAHSPAYACHELGHALGLNHRNQGDSSSCMTPVVYTYQVRPDRHDFDVVNALHAHSD